MRISDPSITTLHDSPGEPIPKISSRNSMVSAGPRCGWLWPSSLLYLVHGVTYLDDGRAIEAQESHFRGESMEFIIELGKHSQYARLMPHDLLRRKISTAMKAVGTAAGH